MFRSLSDSCSSECAWHEKRKKQERWVRQAAIILEPSRDTFSMKRRRILVDWISAKSFVLAPCGLFVLRFWQGSGYRAWP